MRAKLRILEKRRMVFRGIFEKYGFKNNWHGYPETTVLLKNIKDENGKKITNHLWFNYTKGFQRLGALDKGDKIEFHARVKEYIKGYVNRRDFIDERTIDYKLSHPTKFKMITKQTALK